MTLADRNTLTCKLKLQKQLLGGSKKSNSYKNQYLVQFLADAIKMILEKVGLRGLDGCGHLRLF